jgi:hypothetical protein
MLNICQWVWSQYKSLTANTVGQSRSEQIKALLTLQIYRTIKSAAHMTVNI